MTRRSKDLFRQKSPTVAKPRVERSGDDVDAGSEAAERLQKIMASAGIGSRRHCEELILAGRVEVDGRAVRKLGVKVEPGTPIRVDGELLKTARAPVHYLVNKPEGVVCTNYDPAGRTRVVDLVPAHERDHLYTVGRLDMSSEGLILVTNDGELANRLTHPRFGVEKTYVALVAGQMPPEAIDKLRHGVHLAEGVARCVSVHVRKTLPKSTLLEIVLAEGKNREIRRVLAKVGHKVLKLRRTAIGNVKIRELAPGEVRKLTREELKSLREAKPARRKPPVRRPTTVARQDESPATTEVTPIVDTRRRERGTSGTSSDRGPRGRQAFGKSAGRRKDRRREPGTGTIID